jgi:hypothetical protein
MTWNGTVMRYLGGLFLLFAGALQAAVDHPAASPHENDNPNVEEYTWEEQQTVIPDYPDEANLLEFTVDLPDTPFRYYIDTHSIDVNNQDGIVRYTLVILTRNGGSNVSHEGLRCNTKEYKIYAYGDGHGNFRRMRSPEWKSLADSRHTRYRMDLWEHYLCPHKMLERTPEKLIDNIRYFNVDLKDRGFR